MHLHDRSYNTFTRPMTYDFDICGISVRFDVPYEVVVSKESEPFQTVHVKPDLLVHMTAVDHISVPVSEGISLADRWFYQNEAGSSTYHYSAYEKSPYCRVSRFHEDSEKIYCEYVRGKEYLLDYSRNLISLLELETVLLHYNALLIHASLISWEGRGILFTAPSGTGKSTQAELWKKYKNAKILNGDRAGLRRLAGGWKGYGLPYAGSSGVYCNESINMKALAVVRQAKENRVTRISSAEAVRFIYPELNLHRWDSAFVKRSLDLLLQLLSEVPIYLLECLPDEGAVGVLAEQFQKGSE